MRDSGGDSTLVYTSLKAAKVDSPLSSADSRPYSLECSAAHEVLSAVTIAARCIFDIPRSATAKGAKSADGFIASIVAFGIAAPAANA